MQLGNNEVFCQPEGPKNHPGQPLAGTFYRYIRTRFASKPLSMKGAIQNGGRYNVANSFGALYLAFDRETCEAEVQQGIAAGLPIKKGAFTIFEYNVHLFSVLRLGKAEIQSMLGVQEAEITIPSDHWTASEIGEPLFNREDIEGLVAPSAQQFNGKCLDIYLEHLQADSNIAPRQLAIWPEI